MFLWIKYSLMFTILGLLSVMSSDYVYSQGIPNVDFDVTVQQKSDGVLSKSYHLFRLNCWKNDCVLTGVSFNQCYPSSYDRKGFYPKLEYHSTKEGDLEVSKEGNSLLVRYQGIDLGGTSEVSLRFTYKSERTKENIYQALVDFSGGFIKDSFLLKKIITTEYIPLPKKNQLIKMDCDILLPGIEKK